MEIRLTEQEIVQAILNYLDTKGLGTKRHEHTVELFRTGRGGSGGVEAIVTLQDKPAAVTKQPTFDDTGVEVSLS